MERGAQVGLGLSVAGERQADAELLDSASVQELIGALGDHDERHAVHEGAGDAPCTAVTDHRGNAVEDHVLRDPRGDDHA